ncbi:aminoacyl-tRNA hydrolase [Aquicella lusitana]|uniref:Peptidyl-tRNA hydrolase n=1 Tax=Aquicella lusitana TaxID=254246 RepID=A0A370GY58_9COXI|nr:aminoacyl-tRNA hydrolase [Aquicella lusitana]RDI48598.1 peptidyl-tRNA hydrolase [Aquicella lusitana]VVC74025.1 Peptidyl-tRNA hydrolase [Aquicella lusitana]
MSLPIQLIVGLANPGKEYADTRHNAGGWFVEALAHSDNVTLRLEAKYHGLHGVIQLHNQSCHLLIPTTFMNHSGQAVRACMHYHKIPPESILIAHDEIDLPTGIIRLKFDGGDGGHNGLKDVIRHLNTRQFYRLRIGVGRPANSKDVVDYVLNNPSKADRQKIDRALLKVNDILPFLMAGEMQKAMQELHTEK